MLAGNNSPDRIEWDASWRERFTFGNTGTRVAVWVWGGWNFAKEGRLRVGFVDGSDLDTRTVLYMRAGSRWFWAAEKVIRDMI